MTSTGPLAQEDINLLTTEFIIEDLPESTKRTPSPSSPGLDGLPYEIWYLTDTCVSLLPKKGDLSSLSNWRPIALINSSTWIPKFWVPCFFR
ncbi:hypothetical protein INT45_006131 [Circinella minor]|uniref:Uncharacterized protein n=1 Tax=Circinella minor TaxID=1195481 RepID=A0A8H7VJW0_9FUNG|nr:hypothetical protein INT45_006131 [Circinella minor]